MPDHYVYKNVEYPIVEPVRLTILYFKKWRWLLCNVYLLFIQWGDPKISFWSMIGENSPNTAFWGKTASVTGRWCLANLIQSFPRRRYFCNLIGYKILPPWDEADFISKNVGNSRSPFLEMELPSPRSTRSYCHCPTLLKMAVYQLSRNRHDRPTEANKGSRPGSYESKYMICLKNVTCSDTIGRKFPMLALLRRSPSWSKSYFSPRHSLDALR